MPPGAVVRHGDGGRAARPGQSRLQYLTRNIGNLLRLLGPQSTRNLLREGYNLASRVYRNRGLNIPRMPPGPPAPPQGVQAPRVYNESRVVRGGRKRPNAGQLEEAKFRRLREGRRELRERGDGPGTKSWRRFARDYRRVSRLRRYAQQSASRRFNQRFKGQRFKSS